MRRAFALIVLCGLAASASAQTRPDTDPMPHRDLAVVVDSGPVVNTGTKRQVVWSVELQAPDAGWVRLRFDELMFAGDRAAGTGAVLVISALKDGDWQRLDADSAPQWSNTSAYFNGDRVRLELIADPGTGPSRVRMSRFWASEPVFSGRDICGSTDDRVLSSDARQGRLVSSSLAVKCTGWMINDLNNMFLTAGHCGPAAGDIMQFNVPLSTSGGTPQHPPANDQFPVDAASIQTSNGGAIGADHAYFGCNVNSNTGLTPWQHMGRVNYVIGSAPAVSGQTIRVTGYGSVTGTQGTPLTWYCVQKTHTGPYSSLSGTIMRYTLDTTGGNSGSPVIVETGVGAGTAVAIHTHAGCASGGNQGTALQLAAMQTKLANPLSVCATGRGAAVGSAVFAIGDAANNFGQVSTSNGQFDKIRTEGARWEGLTWNARAGNFYAVNNARQLFTVDSAGVSTLVGTLGAGPVINDIAFDPVSQRLYGIAASTGQLYNISTASGLALTAIGAATGGNVSSLTFRGSDFANLYAIDDATAQLVRYAVASGARTNIGATGVAGADFNGLAYNPADGNMYAINAANDQAYRVLATGPATSIGSTLSLFGSAFGMAGVVNFSQPNNNCGSATPISDGATAVSNIGATTDGPVACLNAGDNQVQADVWFRYTASCTGTTTVATCTSDYDTKIAVYSGGCGALNQLACDDDACTTPNSLGSQVAFNTTSGQQYLIRLGGYNGAWGSATLSISCQATCRADLNGDGIADFNDYLEFLNLYNANDLRADFNGDSIVDFNDYLEFLNLYNVGC